MQTKTVSIIIPCRNEERFIATCLDSIIAQDYPKDKLEVFVVDGMSEDGTREIVEKYLEQYTFIKLLENPKKIIPSAMNIGIKNSTGGIIMKVDSHAMYEKDYVSKCVKYLNEYNADNIGGLVIALPRNNTFIGKAIVLSLSNAFGVGNSLFRIGAKEPMWADTAFSGCYRRDVFDRIGLYDENIARSEDIAVNLKLKKSGGKILLVSEIKTYYYARAKFIEFWKHNVDNGFWVTYPLKFSRILFSLRHLIPFLFISSLAGSTGVYMLLNLLNSYSLLKFLILCLLITIICMYFVFNVFFSAKIAVREKDLRYLFIMPVIFASLHVGYGLGSLWGLLKAFCSVAFWKNLKTVLHEV